MNLPTAGGLGHEVMLESQLRQPGPGGGATLSWQPLGLLWADIRPRTGHESLIDGRMTSRVSHEVWIRHRAGTNAAMRFRLGHRILEITAVLPAGSRNQWLRCLCREQFPQAGAPPSGAGNC